ncbi:MAG: MBL fold metallo-hydrolase [Actinomycetota bacterium]|nr:MBL fold metallo-hydrolase [Actinomycetota bacterium]
MEQVADGLCQLRGFPPHVFNVYLMGDVLVDAATRHAHRRILRQLRGHDVRAHALTHAHPDHQGSSQRVCQALGIPYWVGEGDVEAAETGEIARFQPDLAVNRLMHRLLSGPGHPVDRVLREGDDVAGFQVLHVPGHSAGHLAFWRESDRTLVCGDVVRNLSFATALPGLHDAPRAFTPDPVRNRESARRLAALQPALVCFGHGPPLRDTRRFTEFIASLPS